jgi:glycosyltransferase involved in cell wall biosynthesis
MVTASMKASVIIPTLNAGAQLRQCLEMVLGQDTGFPFEVIVIDSISTDQTEHIVRQFPVRFYSIDRKEFDHGLTRRFGVEQASGKYVAFLTQDAIPADKHWLRTLVRALENDGSVAGAYSRQLPKPGCDPIARMRLASWLAGSPERRVTCIISRASYDALSPWQKRRFINFDNVSSCVSKPIMQKFPFAKAEFGEDLDWSRRVLEAGYKIVYEPASQVYHSHQTSILGNYRRAFIDHRTMKARLNVDFASQMFPSPSSFILNASWQQLKADWAAIRRSDLRTLPQAKWMLYAVPMEVLEKIGCVRGARSTEPVRDHTRRKRIVLVTHDFPPDHYGGVAVYSHTLAKELSKRHDVHVFYRTWDSSRADYSVDTQTYDGLPVTTINNNFAEKRNALMRYRDRYVDEAFRRFLAERRPDLVHFQYLGTGLSTNIVRMAHRYGIPTILTLNDYWFMCPKGQMMNYEWQMCSEVIEERCARCVFGSHASLSALEEPQRGGARNLGRSYRTIADGGANAVALRRLFGKAYWMLAGRRAALNQVRDRNRELRRLLNEVDLLIAPSQFLRRMYVGFGVPPERIRYSDYGINTVAARKSPRSPSGRLVFGYIGTLMPPKGVHVLVDAFLKLPEGLSELRIHGPAPNKFHLEYRGMIEQKVAGRNDILLLGAYEPSDIMDILASIDAVVVPSTWHENSPLTIHEAFMAGVPVITSNIGGMAELVTDGVNGLHFQAGDADDLARKLMALIETPDLLAQLSAGIPPIKSIEENAKELEAMYAELMGHAAAAR